MAPGVASMMLSMVGAAVVVGVGWLIGRLGTTATKALLEGTSVDPLVRRLLARAILPTIMVVAVALAMEVLGVGAIRVVSTLAWVIPATALVVLANGGAGAMLLSLRPYSLGDRVQLARQEGTVERLDLWTTTLRTDEGHLLTLASVLILFSAMRNLSRTGRRTQRVLLPLPRNAQVVGVRDALEAWLAADPRVLPAARADVQRVHVGALLEASVVLEACFDTLPEQAEAVASDLRLAALAAGPSA